MKLYALLSKISFLRNRFVAKFLFMAILGILVPAVIMLFLVIYSRSYFAPLDLFLIALGFMAAGTVLITIILKQLLSPILQAAEALVNYGINLAVPQLPANYTDEAGLILKNIQTLIQSNQKLLTEKKELCHALTTDLRKQTLNTESLITAIYTESTSSELKKKAFDAIDSLQQQIKFVDTYVELLVQEELINKQPIKVRKVNLEELFEEVKLKRKVQLESKKISINFKLTISKVRLKVSNTLLLQALGYIVDNAIKYAPEGTKLDISTEKKRGKLQIQIKDFGIGFDPRQADEMFSKFHLLNQNKAKYDPGAGIYLASQIVERFGGSMVAESDGINRGARFSIELKLYR